VAPRGAVSSGLGILSIRPEDIEFGVASEGENVVAAKVRSHVYVGTYTKYKIDVMKTTLEVIAEAKMKETFSDGSVVTLDCLPKRYGFYRQINFINLQLIEKRRTN
jgi:ABC-type Fe3+/spermidine/putrescine transport system ATPase subunit